MLSKRTRKIVLKIHPQRLISPEDKKQGAQSKQSSRSIPYLVLHTGVFTKWLSKLPLRKQPPSRTATQRPSQHYNNPKKPESRPTAQLIEDTIVENNEAPNLILNSIFTNCLSFDSGGLKDIIAESDLIGPITVLSIKITALATTLA